MRQVAEQVKRESSAASWGPTCKACVRAQSAAAAPSRARNDMLARCVEQALGAPDQLEKALRRGRRPVSKAASGLGALDALLVRAEREAKDGGAA